MASYLRPRTRGVLSRHPLILVLLLALVGLLGGCSASTTTVTTHPSGSAPTSSTDTSPQEALTTYAADLKQGNYHNAYNHLSMDYKNTFNNNPKTEKAYTAAESAVINRRGGIKTYTVGSVIMTDVGYGTGSPRSGAKSWIDYSYADGSRERVSFLLILEGSHWKILSEISNSRTA